MAAANPAPIEVTPPFNLGVDEPYRQNIKPRRLETGQFSVMMFGAGS